MNEEDIITLLKQGFIPSKGKEYKNIFQEIIKLGKCGCSAESVYNKLIKHYNIIIKRI